MSRFESSASIGEGQKALGAAQWAEAKHAFEAALRIEDCPEAHDGLGIALWWLNEIKSSHEQRILAYKGYKQRGDAKKALRIALWVGREQVFLDWNTSAMNGWFARAERLLNEIEPCVETGWYQLLRASMEAAPSEMEQLADLVIKTARLYADIDLEAAALAFGGQARVAGGQIEGGIKNIDEAMATVTSGEVADMMVVSEIFCVTLSTCELLGDWIRTEHWCRAADEYARRFQCTFLSAYCRTTYGGLLVETGRWREAETQLSEAISIFEQGHRGLRIHAILKLAELRVFQGRYEEAEVLLRGFEDSDEARIPLGRLYLARNQAEMARAAVEPLLRQTTPPTLGQAPVLLLWVDVCLARGDVEKARLAAAQLAEIAEQARSQLLLAQADLARGHISREVHPAEALEYFQSGLKRLYQYEQSLLAARVKFELARTLVDSDRAAAITWAKAALATFERLGAEHESDETAGFLRQMGVAGRAGLPAHEQLTGREGEVLDLLARGLSNKEIAERLVISAKTVEHHVSQVLAKLGLRSRAEAAAYLVSQSSLKK